MNITLMMPPQGRRYHSKITQCETAIRRFDSSGRDNPRRSYWWWQRRKWELKLHPELKIPLYFIDRPSFPPKPDPIQDILSRLHGAFHVQKRVLTVFDPARDSFEPLQLTVSTESYRELLASATHPR